MQGKTWIAAALAAGSLMGLGAVAHAVPAVVATGPAGHVVRIAPPPPLHEVMPAARPGFVWSPGHYAWRGDRYVWNAGSWVATRPGYAWQPPHWQQQGPDHWVMVGGRWVPTDNIARYDDDDEWQRGPMGDRDGDGVRNADDADRDGDGIRNSEDAYPNNPNRS